MATGSLVSILLRLVVCSSAFGVTTHAGPSNPQGTFAPFMTIASSQSTSIILTVADENESHNDDASSSPDASTITIAPPRFANSSTIGLNPWSDIQTIAQHGTNSDDPQEPLTAFSWERVEWSWHLIIQFISAIVGIVGNFLVSVVLFQRRRKSRSTDTLVSGLAWADMLTSFCLIPIPLASFVPDTNLGRAYCVLLYRRTVLWISITASTYLLVTISVERFLAVVYPFHFKYLVTRRRVSVFIVIIWTFAILSVFHTFIINVVDKSSNMCVQQYMSTTAKIAMAYYWFCLRLIVPSLFMLVTQILIARTLQRQAARFKDLTSAQDSSTGGRGASHSFHLVARNRIIKLMLIIVLTFLICWSPNQIAYLGYKLQLIPRSYLKSPLHLMLTVLGFYNSCANPVIYAARYPEFRAALKDIVTCTSPKNVSLFEKGDVTDKPTVSHNIDNNAKSTV